jgi:hypothetical protein
MDHQPITPTQSDDQPKVYFADLRHEVELAARRHAELSSALDIYADELSHIAFAVTGDRDGIGFDQIVDHVKAVVVERDRLRAVVEAVSVMWDNVVHANPEGTLMGFPLSDYDTLERVLDALDVSPGIGGEE